eukprot:scaffold8450_cov215-Amphora_coffeaeformis.AAC.6
MKSHRRSHSDESGWISTMTEETMGQGSLPSVVTNSSSLTKEDLLIDIPLGEDSSGTGASFLPEDHSRDGSSCATVKTKGRKTLAPASVACIVDQVLMTLQRARSEHQEENASSFGEKGTQEGFGTEQAKNEETAVNATPEGIDELKYSLKTYNNMGISTGDLDLLHRVEDFHRARFLRRQHGNSILPCGVFGLFQILSDLQLDLTWAEDAAWRRENGAVYLSWSDFVAIRKQTLQPTYFVYGMMFISTILLLVSFYLNDWEFAPVSVNPLFGPTPDVFFRMGALDRIAVVEEGEWYRLVAPMFLHAGLLHFALNTLVLFFVGSTVESRHGTAETILLFLLTAIGGNIASTLFMLPSISVGASGGIFGLLGVCLADIIINWDLLTLKNHYCDTLDPAHKSFPYVMALFWLVVEIIVNALLGFTPYVDQVAHIAGLVFGIGFGIPFLQWLRGSGFFGRASPMKHCLCGLVRFCLFTVTMGAFLTMMFLLMNNDGEPLCENCSYLSCVPFPFWEEKKWWDCDKCDLTIGKIDRFTPTTVVDLSCPGFGTIQVDLLETVVDRTLIQSNFSSYCREYCPV